MLIKDLYPVGQVAACHHLLSLFSPHKAAAVLLSSLFDEKLSNPADDYYEEDLNILWVLMESSDWAWGYYVDWRNPIGFVEQIEQLAKHWGISIDLPQPDDGQTVASLMAQAYEAFAKHKLALWFWDALEDNYCGWITRIADSDAVNAVAATLNTSIQPANFPYENELENYN